MEKKMEKTKVSFILPIGPNVNADICINSLKKLEYPKKLLEVIVAEGRSPSLQRNLACEKATGSIVYFVDDDVEVDPKALEYILKYYEDEDVSIVGGPMVTPVYDPLIARCFGYTMETFIGAASMRYRFKPLGDAGEADETHLVLCNLSCRRDTYLKEGGLRVDLYPNEENEFFNRLSEKGYKMIYEPKALVNHSRASTILGVIKKNLGYGRGRMEQLLIQPSCFRPVFLIPTLFLTYLLSIPYIVDITGSVLYLIP